MTRLQRNRLRREKKRRKWCFILGVGMCISILIGGLLVTNNLMVKMTAMPEDENLFYIDNVIGSAKHMISILKEGIMWIEDKFVRVYNYIVERTDISGFS